MTDCARDRIVRGAGGASLLQDWDECLYDGGVPILE